MKKADQFGRPISPGSLGGKGKLIEIEGIQYREVPPNKYVCSECGTQINRVLANAHSFKHMRQRIAASNGKEISPRVDPHVARKQPTAYAAPPPSLASRAHCSLHGCSSVAILPQKRQPTALELLSQWRHVDHALQRLSRHLSRSALAALLVGFRSLRCAT